MPTPFAKAFIAVFSVSSLFGLDPNLALTQYVHTNWTQRHGFASPSVKALAQTKDGYMWLGTATGLFRFDGMNIVHWKPTSESGLPRGEVRILHAAGDGGLWIGTPAGVSKLDGSNVKSYTPQNGLADGFLTALYEDRGGRLWAGSTGSKLSGLSVIEHGLVRRVDPKLPNPNVLSFFEDRGNDIWIGTSNGLCHKLLELKAACLSEIHSMVVSIPVEKDGSLLIADGASRSVLRY